MSGRSWAELSADERAATLALLDEKARTNEGIARNFEIAAGDEMAPAETVASSKRLAHSSRARAEYLRAARRALEGISSEPRAVERCRNCGATFRCRLCGLDVELRRYITQGEAAGLCGGCYSRPTIFGWQLGDMVQQGAWGRWLRWAWSKLSTGQA